MKWSDDQDKVLFDHGNKGAAWCRDEIERQFGASRSVSATQRRASRIGAPMAKYEVCPSCGRIARVMPTKGLCRACNAERLHHNQAVFATKIRRDMAESDEAANRANRKYQALRKKNERFCEANGLPKYREKSCEDSVNLSRKMSSTWSKGQCE